MTTNHNELHDQYKRGEITHDQLLDRQRQAYLLCAKHNMRTAIIGDDGLPVCEGCIDEQDREDRLRTKSYQLISGGYPL